jgi:PHD/YefM family antitoxin component YafN of YafNO toxin-antitoxin module
MLTTIQNFKNNINGLFDKIEDIREPLVVERQGENMVVLAQMDYNSMLKTIYQINSSANGELINEARKPKESSISVKEKILSFAGIFSDMSDKNYKDLTSELKKTRKTSFNRSFDL